MSALLVSVVLISGCSTASDISVVPPMTLEEVAGKRLAQMSNDEKEGLIYQYVSDRIIVDKDRLIEVSAKDKTAITGIISDVSLNLQGKNKDALDPNHANYLLTEFARTPYEWKQSSVDIVGFDPAARLYFVDVTYSTTNSFKSIIPSSKLPNGATDSDSLKQKRYKDYIAYLTYKSRGMDTQASDSLAAFEKAWGTVDSVMMEQQGTSLLDRTKSYNQDSGGLGKLTYSGLVEDSAFNQGADLTVRYVLKYKFNLGEETDLQVESLYLKNYKLKSADNLLQANQTSQTVGVEVLKPFVDKLIISYHKAFEESNYNGLFSLFDDFSGVDKYYEDINLYTYNSIGGYNYRILSRNGKNLKVQVTRVNNIRAKGAEMSLPTYNEKLIYNLVLTNEDKLKVKSVYLVESELVGEPISVIKNVSGISDLIQYSGDSFTDGNKAKVEQTLKDFASVVFSGKVDTPEFSSAVDVGVSQVTLKKMTDVITAIPDSNRKTNYLVSWDTKTNVYVSVTMREIFETSEGNYDTESVVDLVNRAGEWKVVNYTRTLSVKTGAITSNPKNVLSEDTK